MSLDIFQRSSGLTKLLGSHRFLRKGSIGPVAQALAFVCGYSVRCSYLGKIHPSASLSPSAPEVVERYRPSLGGRGSLAIQVPNWESLKVIALDKFHVNSNLSSGNFARQTTIYQRLVR
jgi:hypothetical protein